MPPPALEGRRAFRQQVSPPLGGRRDARFELVDALLSAPTLETPAPLSLVPRCPRGGGRLSEALHAGTMDLSPLEALVASAPLRW